MLTSVSIHNYNCFAEFVLALPRRLLLVGSNGSGKTSLWEALAAIQDFAVRGAEAADVFPTRSLTRWLAGESVQRFGLDLSVGTETFHYTLEIAHDLARRVPQVRCERLAASGETLYEAIDGDVRLFGDRPRPEPRTQFPFGRKRSFLAGIEPRSDNRRTIAFREALGEIWLLEPSLRRFDATTSAEETWLERDGANFPSWLRSVLADRPEIGASLNDALRPVLPGLKGVSFERMSSEIRELMLSFQVAGADFKLSASELSDGQRALLLLHGFLIAAGDRAGTVFLDEPELGLAPHEMQPWLAAMAAALEARQGQLIVISHHPAVIDYMAPEQTVRFFRPGGGPARVEPVTLETTGGAPLSDWLARPWAYEDEHEQQPSA